MFRLTINFRDMEDLTSQLANLHKQAENGWICGEGLTFVPEKKALIPRDAEEVRDILSEAFQTSNKIRAIKAVRERTGLTLRQSKILVDRFYGWDVHDINPIYLSNFYNDLGKY